MKRTEWLQETRKMRFEEAYGGWFGGRLTQDFFVDTNFVLLKDFEFFCLRV